MNTLWQHDILEGNDESRHTTKRTGAIIIAPVLKYIKLTIKLSIASDFAADGFQVGRTVLLTESFRRSQHIKV